ncbi:MAG: hypothetical protein IKR63_07630 [Alloprevotella sp.]|nr:hypothetical protein [Alloprevotella sp.]
MIFFAEVPLILAKQSNANRAQRKQACLIFFVEVPLILAKQSNANRAQRKWGLLDFLCRGAAYLGEAADEKGTKGSHHGEDW